MSAVPVEPAEAQLLVGRSGGLGRIRLNRPKALNSLTLDMVRGMEAALDEFEKDPAVAAVLVTGEGERGLCAGGDIRALYESGLRGDDAAAIFWSEEYRLNARITHYPKPYVAFMDGITMGGGVGISVHGAHRVVTERTRMAMPETGIGFLPDVGGTWILPRTPGEAGTYLGLTGETIGAADAIFAGFADLLVPSASLDALAGALSDLLPGAGNETVRSVISRFAEAPGPSVLETNRAVIDRTMAADEVESILAALDADGGEFAAKTTQTIRGKSPSSLILTLRLLRLGRASRTLEECLEREFAGATAILKDHDFYEGVRAAIIRKDRNPRWSPATLDAVDPKKIDAYLAPAKTPVFGG